MINQTQPTLDLPPGLIVCAGAVVLCENKVLLIRQAKGHSLAGQWVIPWGLVESNELPNIAALREIQEEANVTASIKGLLGIQNLPQPWEGWIAILYLCHHISGTPAPDGDIETDRAAYFSQEEVDALKEPLEPWCRWLVSRVLQGEYHLIPPELNNPYYPQPSFL